MFGPKTALAIILLAATAVWSEVSPDQTCGVAKAGNNKGYTCPIEIKCCGGSGYCGASDAHCLTTVGCQDKYSNATGSCTKPIDGVSISPDGTCGFAGVGAFVEMQQHIAILRTAVSRNTEIATDSDRTAQYMRSAVGGMRGGVLIEVLRARSLLLLYMPSW
ncbi:carbohydrate-binding module family 18 protein [Hypoxylon sp. CO27-5]|nr:carbohydrate-binding module family 18 protein [Hypoxylon sp. CO27-5]